MLLQESRRTARASPSGEIILLPDQDRSLWNREQIAEGVALVERALASRRFGPYALQAAIAAVHAEAPARRRHGLGRDRRALRRPAAGGALARHRAQSGGRRGHARRARAPASSWSTRSSPAASSPDYHLAHATRADLCRRLGRSAEARAAYERAIDARPAGARAALSRRDGSPSCPSDRASIPGPENFPRGMSIWCPSRSISE